MTPQPRKPDGGPIGTVLWHVTMSLDGLIAGPGDAMSWVLRYADPNPAVDEVISTTGAVLAGRRSYDVSAKEEQRPEARKVYGGAWTGPVFVLTHEVPHCRVRRREQEFRRKPWQGLGTVRATVYKRLRKLREPSGS